MCNCWFVHADMHIGCFLNYRHFWPCEILEYIYIYIYIKTCFSHSHKPLFSKSKDNSNQFPVTKIPTVTFPNSLHPRMYDFAMIAII